MAEVMRMSKLKVMVAMDESDCSFYALKWTVDHVFGTAAVATPSLEEASPEEVDMVILVHVQQPFQHYGFPAGPGGSGLYSACLGGRIIIIIIYPFLFHSYSYDHIIYEYNMYAGISTLQKCLS